MFNVVRRDGLRFQLKAKDRAEACRMLMRMLGRSSVPLNISVTPA